MQGRENIENSPQNSTQETECLPQENVSIIEDMTTEDKIENMKAIVNGTMRRKLYFNPAYFEPHLLLVNANLLLIFLNFAHKYLVEENLKCSLFVVFFSLHHRLQLNFCLKYVRSSPWLNIKWQRSDINRR